MLRSPTAACVTALAALGLASLASAATYPGAPPCDGTLQACIDATPSGGTVEIATDGPIAESISFEKGLTLEAADGFAPEFAAGHSIFAATPTSGSHFIRIAGLTLLGGPIQIAQGTTGTFSVEIIGNRITTGGFVGIEIYSGTGGAPRGPVFLNVEENDVTLNGGGGEARGIAIGLNDMGDASGVIRGNRVELDDNAQGAAIDIANGSHAVDVAVVRNRVLGTSYNTGIGAFQYGAGTLTVRVFGNEVRGQFGNSGAPAAISVNVSEGAATAEIVNNTVAGNRLGLLVSGRTDLGAQVDGLVVNNLFASNERGMTFDSLLGVADRNNLFFANTSNFGDEEGPPFVPGAGTVFGDPHFVAPDDFDLGPGSAARDAGDSSAVPGLLAVDLALRPRIQGAAVDIGAYEAPEPGAALAGVVALFALAAAARRSGR